VLRCSGTHVKGGQLSNDRQLEESGAFGTTFNSLVAQILSKLERRRLKPLIEALEKIPFLRRRTRICATV
jgi:hypothetical protein